MPANAYTILGDLGGTHLRLARQGAHGPENIRNYTTADWPSLADVLRDYASDLNGARLYLSFAKKVNDDGVYQLDQAHKKGAWSFTIDALKQDCGLQAVEVLHDLKATGLAVFHQDSSVFTAINARTATPGWRVIISVGTGLGHAFADPQTLHVQDTFGGHFPAIAVTDEQRKILAQFEQDFPKDRNFIAEEILSGRGYQALERIDAQNAPRLFCEFLGLYANTLSVAMHAFGGVYLCGGVIERLFAAGKFDQPAFDKFYILNNVPIVDAALCASPIYRADKPHTALYGLDVYATSLSDH